MTAVRPSLTVSIAAAWLAACGGGSGPGEATQASGVQAVSTVAVERIELQQSLPLPGIVKPARRAVLSTRTSGIVETVSVEAGDAVIAGQLLIEVESRDLESALEAARLRSEAAAAALDKAERDVQRLERLFADELIALSRLEDARLLLEQRQAELSAARAAVRARRVALDYARIKAPFDGITSEVLVDRGAFVGPGTPLLVVEARAGFEVDASVTQAIADRLRPGQAVTVTLPGGDEHYRGTLQAVIPALEGGGAGSVVRVTVEDDVAGLRPGQVVDVMLPVNDSVQTAWQIPAEAVFSRGQLHGVFVAVDTQDGTRARLRWVTLDPHQSPKPGYRVVLEGLAAGERVVVGDAPRRLADGQPIRAVREPGADPGP